MPKHNPAHGPRYYDWTANDYAMTYRLAVDENLVFQYVITCFNIPPDWPEAVEEPLTEDALKSLQETWEGKKVPYLTHGDPVKDAFDGLRYFRDDDGTYVVCAPEGTFDFTPPPVGRISMLSSHKYEQLLIERLKASNG